MQSEDAVGRGASMPGNTGVATARTRWVPRTWWNRATCGSWEHFASTLADAYFAGCLEIALLAQVLDSAGVSIWT